MCVCVLAYAFVCMCLYACICNVISNVIFILKPVKVKGLGIGQTK